MSSISTPAGLPGPSAGSAATPTKAVPSVPLDSLKEALAIVKEIALGNSGAAILRQIRDQRAAAAQERLGRAQERYEFLRKTMIKVLGAGDARSAARIAKEAASLAREVGNAAKDVAKSVKGDAAGADAASRRDMLDGFVRQARRLVLGVRNIVEAARIANDGSEAGAAQARRAKDIRRAYRDTDEALQRLDREIGSARLVLASGASPTISIDA